MSGALDALQAETEQAVHAPPPQAERFLQYGPIALDLEKRLVIVQGAGDSGSPRRLQFAARIPKPPRRAHRQRAGAVGLPDATSRDGPLAPRAGRGALGYDLGGPEARDIVRPHISRLRKKIEPDPTQPRLIVTVRGKGYMLSPS